MGDQRSASEAPGERAERVRAEETGATAFTTSRNRDCRLCEKTADAFERARPQAVVRVRPPLLAFEQAGLHELLQMVTDRRLLDAVQRLEIADAHRLSVGLDQAVEDLQPVSVGERLEELLEL